MILLNIQDLNNNASIDYHFVLHISVNTEH